MDGIHYSSLWRFGIFFFSYYTFLLTPIDLESEHDLLGNPFAKTSATRIHDANYEQTNVQNVAFDQHHLLFDQQRDLFNIPSNTTSYLMSLWESIVIKRFTLTSNLELSQCVTALILYLTQIDKPLKKSSITWSSLASLRLAQPLNGHPQPLLFPKRMVMYKKLPIYAH